MLSLESEIRLLNVENKKVKGSFNDCCHIMLSLELLDSSDTRRLNVKNKKVKGSFNDLFISCLA